MQSRLAQCGWLSFVALAVVLTRPGPGWSLDAVQISTCGTWVTRAAVRLVGDLDCSGGATPAVILEDGASLDLAGYTVTGPAVPGQFTIRCNRSCKVVGPGTVSGGSVGIGDPGLPGRVQVRGVTVRDASGEGIIGARVDVRDSIIVDNGRATGGCGIFVGAYRAKVVRTEIRGNGCGLFNHGRQKAVIRQSTITDNVPLATPPSGRLIGVLSLAGAVLRDSIVTGHLAGIPPLGPRCDFLGCGDLITFERAPQLERVECGNSVDLRTAPVGSWGVCANDADFDGDGTPNAGDGCDVDPTCAPEDGDVDGVGDCCDDCVDTPNPNQLDFDRDGAGDACDLDIDDDGTPNDADLCDLDVRCAEQDADGDGVGDCCDNCPTVSNPDQSDVDNDNDGDVCDNCPTVANPVQTDTNDNGIGDACE